MDNFDDADSRFSDENYLNFLSGLSWDKVPGKHLECLIILIREGFDDPEKLNKLFEFVNELKDRYKKDDWS